MKDRFEIEWYWDGELQIHKASARRSDFPKRLVDSPDTNLNDLKDWVVKRIKTKYGIDGFVVLQWGWKDT